MAVFFKRNILDKAMMIGAVLSLIITGFTAFAEDCEEKPQSKAISAMLLSVAISACLAAVSLSAEIYADGDTPKYAVKSL